MSIDRKNLTAGLLYLALAIGAGFISIGYRLGTLERMGAGMFPLMVCGGLAIVGLILIAKSLVSGHRELTFQFAELRPVIFVTIAVALFGALLIPFGLAAAIVALIGVSAFGNPRQSWRSTFWTAVAIIPATWLIFVKLLGVTMYMLPRGWGF